MDMLQQVIERLRAARDVVLDGIAEASGVPRPTVAKIKYGQTRDPRASTLQRLYACLCETEHRQ